jgi:hypothetical protein
MNILALLSCLLIGLIWACFSVARSFSHKGRLKGMEEACRELVRGVQSHYELSNGQGAPATVASAINDVTAATRTAGNSVTKPYPHLWRLGHAVGEACWLKGHTAGIRRKTPAAGKIRVDLSVIELLQLSRLAHLGFHHMMPNYRGLEIHRFAGEQDAREGSIAIVRIEGAIPAEERPFEELSSQLMRRQNLIRDWWQDTSAKLIA